MQQHDYTGILPEQYTGKEIEAESSCTLGSRDEAISAYKTARQRLLNVNKWHELAGTISAVFSLRDSGGEALDRNVMVGDYFRVNIPGPGSTAGAGYDWVQVEDSREINENDVQSTAIRVRPCAGPFGDKDKIAHFYSGESTSTFIVTREANMVKAIISDRNISPNGNVNSVKDKVRDLAVGLGAMTIFSKIQWQHLADGFVKKSTN